MEDILLEEKKFLEQKICPICFCSSFVVESIKTINPNSEKKVELRECDVCGHWWHNPLPSQDLLNSLYQTGSAYVVPVGYGNTTVTPSEHDYKLWEKVFDSSARFSKKIDRKNNSFNYLELGIGSGHLFSFFKEKANISYGVEPGEWVTVKDKNIVSDIEKIPNNVRFDMIIAHDVIEHLSSPQEMLTKLHDAANAKCVINCTFPNKDASKAFIQKGSWHMIRPFGHLHYFSSKSIKRVFKDSGWDIVEMRKCRISDSSIIDLIKQFDLSKKHFLYRILKSLLLGQIILGKDQWSVTAVRQ